MRNAGNVRSRFVAAFGQKDVNVGAREAAGEDPLTLQQLGVMANKMTDDEHLRMSSDRVLYTKVSHGVKRDGFFNHAEARFWEKSGNSGRAKKFNDAKRQVLRTVAKSVGDSDVALGIMTPFLNSSKALSKADLTRIVSAAKQYNLARSKVDNLVRSDTPNSPRLSNLVNHPDTQWADAFDEFCRYQDSDAFTEAKQLTDLVDRLGRSGLPGDFELLSEEAKQRVKTEVTQECARAQGQALEVLKRKDLTPELRSALTEFTKLTEAPASTKQLQELSKQFRAASTGMDSEVGNLKQDFEKFVLDIRTPSQEQVAFGGVTTVPLKQGGVRVSDVVSPQIAKSPSDAGSYLDEVEQPTGSPVNVANVVSDAHGPNIKNADEFLAAQMAKPENNGPQSVNQSSSGPSDANVKSVDAASTVSSSSSNSPDLQAQVRSSLTLRFEAIGLSQNSPAFETCLQQVSKVFERHFPDAAPTPIGVARMFAHQDVQSAMMNAFANDQAMRKEDPTGVRNALELLNDKLVQNVHNGLLGDEFSYDVSALDEQIADVRDTLERGHPQAAAVLLRDVRAAVNSLVSKAIVERESTMTE